MESKSAKEENQNIKVFVRVRPRNVQEISGKSAVVIECPAVREVVVKERTNDKLTKTFSFDRVFSAHSTQVEVYNFVVKPLIAEVLAGYNCTVFAYGQTGSGKTHTMEGNTTKNQGLSWQNDPALGLIPRAFSQIFDELQLLDAEYTVRASFLELYNEELIDLLSAVNDSDKLRLFEDATKRGSVICSGLQEVSVKNKHEVYRLLERGSMRRQTAATRMNATSSRSHTILTITVHIKENSVNGDELLKVGKLNLVDLAGSENIGRSGAIDRRAREAGNINQSLLTLGRVITALVEKAPHIPYRESKLTRLLQDSLGGRTKTSIIATISPAQINLEETLSTLDYAHRAKNITNKPEVNQKLSKRALLKEYTDEIDRLRKDLLASREKNGFYVDEENYNFILQQLDLQAKEISDKVEEIQVLIAKREELQSLCDELQMSLCSKAEYLERTEALLDSAVSTVQKQNELEQKLTEQAITVKNVADCSYADSFKLHDALDRKRTVENKNKQELSKFNGMFRSATADLQRIIKNDKDTICSSQDKIQDFCADHNNILNNELDQLKYHIVPSVQSQIDSIQNFGKTCSKQAEENEKHLKSFILGLESLIVEKHGMENQSNGILEQMKEQLYDYVEEEKKKFKNIVEFLNEQSRSILTCIQEYNTYSNNKKVEFENQLQTQLAEKESIYNSIKMRVKNKEKERIRQMMQLLTEIDKSCDETHNSVMSDADSLLSQDEEILRLIQSVKEEETNTIGRVLCSVGDKLTNNSEVATEYLSENNGKAEAFKIDQEKAIVALKKLNESTRVDAEESISEMKSLVIHLNKELDLQQQNNDSLVQVCVKSFSDIKESSSGRIDCIKSENSKFLSEHLKLLNIGNEAVSCSAVNLAAKIRAMESDVDLFNRSLTFDVSSGATPPRKIFQYPSSFASCTPPHGLMQKYEELKKEVQGESQKDERKGAHVLEPGRSLSLNDLSQQVEPCINHSISMKSLCESKENISKHKEEITSKLIAGLNKTSQTRRVFAPCNSIANPVKQESRPV